MATQSPRIMDASRFSGPALMAAAEVVAGLFDIGNTRLPLERMGPGLINATFRLGPNRHGRSFVLQALNPVVFPRPREVMANTVAVLRHLARHGQTLPVLPTLVPTRRDGALWVEHEQVLWRCWQAVEPSVCHEFVDCPHVAAAAAHAFGVFHHDLRSFPVETLHVTIADFHHTPNRLAQLHQAAAADPLGRLRLASAEYEQLCQRSAWAQPIQKALDRGEIPLRIAHNDTKISNVLFHHERPQALCVIDLDTVMPGSLLHDFGDLVRTTLGPPGEDAPDDLGAPPSWLPRFEALVEGFLQPTASILTPAELALLADSAAVITYELALRFLTDFLAGDRYFAVSKPDHNLVRCRSQLALLKAIESQLEAMREVVRVKSLQNYPI